MSRFWMAPSLEYLPVRAEQIRKGKVETVMVLQKAREAPSCTRHAFGSVTPRWP